MTPTEARRPRRGMTWLALALGALALLAMPSLAAAKDRNHDRIPDHWEKRHKLSLQVKQARLDQDHDQLRNRAEFLAGDDPRDHDSDDDGVMDGDEQAGTISSFDAETGRLVIDLFGTDTIAGFVTDSTEIECEDDFSASASDSGPSDNSGPGSQNSGPGHDGDDDQREDGDDDRICTTAELVPGAVVEEAELKLDNGQAVFREIELSGRSAQAATGA